MSSFKVRLLTVSAVILVLCAISWFFLQGEPTGPTGVGSARNEARPAPAFSLKDHSGLMHRLQDARGKLVIVHFWAAWCPPCLQEIPDLVEFAEKLQDQAKLEIIAISLDEKWDDAEKVLASSKLPKNMISLLDGGAKIPDEYGTYQYPETYLVSPEGRILAKWVGGQPWNTPRTIEMMKQELAKVR